MVCCWRMCYTCYSIIFPKWEIVEMLEYNNYHPYTKSQMSFSLGDFRLISCCHTLYKCISKLLCSSLSRVLGKIISQTQRAFVAGRYITHNILLCHNLVNHYSRKHCYPSCLLKVDLWKAYDTMDWEFSHDMLIAFNFPPHFIKIVMTCISSI